jgi:pimeloyl-ACP methyl ester carboxylesterase
MSTNTYTLNVDTIGTVPVTVTESGEGRPILLLHGGGGPLTVAGFAALLSSKESTRVLTPMHPGFGATPRPEALTDVRGLAALYVALLDELDLADVTVIGNSIGGWIASEMALLGSPRIGRVVLANAVGIEVDGHPVADFFSLTLPEVAQLSYHDPVKFAIDPSKFTPEQQAVMAGNRAALAVYGSPMTDPTLHGRLSGVTVPTLVVWGEADRIVDPEYGSAFASAIPDAKFQLLTETGHMPQLETPDGLLQAVTAFIA